MNNLPPHWSWVKLGEIAKLIRGVSYKKDVASKSSKPNYLPIVRANNINTSLHFDDLVYVPKELIKEEQFIKVGDIVIAMSSGSKDLVGKAAQAQSDSKTAFGTFCGLIRFNSEKVYNKFFGFYFHSKTYRDHISKLSMGVNINNLRREHIEELDLPLPPLPEQKKIVEKIEELFSGLDSGVASLKKAKEQIRLYRQAVLAAAFSGKLVSAQITSEEGGINNEELIIKNESQKNNSSLFILNSSLPTGWKWVKFIDFCRLQRGYDLPLKSIQTGKYPVLTSGGINGYHNEFKADGPCLITGRSGSVGNIHFIDVEKYWPHNTVLYVKDFCNNLPKFIYYYFLQFNFKKFSSSTAVPTLDRKKLYNEQIKLPPLNQQTEIVEEIEKRFSEADNLEKAIDDSLAKSEILRQSILSRAFSGKLV